MPTSSDQLDSRSRKNLSTILKGLASAGQVSVAEALSKDESTVSKMKDKELPQLARLLSACGLKVVPHHVKCYEPRKIDAVIQFAKAYLDGIDNPDDLGLAWDE